MTNEEKLNIAVEKRVGLISALNKESTQTQIFIEYAETEKAKHCMLWLLSIADERKNKKLYDCITLLNKRLEKHAKLISDLKHYEAKANYYEMMYKSMQNYKKENEILVNKLMSKF